MTVGVRLSDSSLKTLQEVSQRTKISIGKLVREIVDLGIDFIVEKYDGVEGMKDNKVCDKPLMSQVAIYLPMDTLRALDVLCEDQGMTRHMIVAKFVEENIGYLEAKYSNFKGVVSKRITSEGANVRICVAIPVLIMARLDALAKKYGAVKPYFIREAIGMELDD